jgi:amino acid adenylation domain-containing protein
MVFPVVVKRSKGSRLWDIDGNEYIDLLNGFGPIMFGHRPDFVEKALSSQLAEGLEIGPQTPLAGEVAELFCDMTGNERMTFCNTGSEAVMAAFRLARTVTGRDRIVMFAGDYHGMFDEVLVTASGGRPNALPIAPGIPRESNANVVVLDYGTAESLAWIRAHAHALAAVIVEPVQSRRPDFQPIEFLKELREVTRASGTALIFDEIVTGFRAHPGGCQALFGIRADLATYGKVLGGGMPIGVLAGRAEFMDALDGGAWTYGDASAPEVGVTFFAGTFVRHPLSLSAVKAVLKELAAQGPALQERLTARTAAMVGRINGVFEHWGVPARVAHFSSVMFFRFPAEERLAGLFYYFLRERGIHAIEGFPCFLTTAHSDADIDQIVGAFESAVRQMAEAHFFQNARAISVSEVLALPKTCKLTEAQREVFLGAMLDPAASTAFNESVVLHLRGSLDVMLLRGALADVVARHEALRARVDADGEHMVIAHALGIPLIERDISALDETARGEAYSKFLDADAHDAFDMHKAPLIRWTLLKLDNAHHALVMTAHHIICDGWSTNVILEELAALYSSRTKTEPVKLPDALRFTDYARARETATASDDGRSTESYWLELFKDKPHPIDLPTDRPRGSVRSVAGATARYQMPAGFASMCRKFAAGEKSSLFMVLLTGFNALLAKLSKSSDIVVGVPMAGQSALGAGNLVGHCVDFLPLRANVAGNTTFRSLLKATRARMLEAADHQSYTYGTLVGKLAITRNPGRLPLMEVHFNLEQVGRGVAFAGLTATVEPNAKTGVNPDLFLNLVDGENEFTAYCDYNKDLYDETTIQSWMRDYTELIKAAIAAPDGELAGLLGTAPERTGAATLTQIAEWNRNTTVAYPPKGLVALFEEQVRTTPGSIAVAQGEIAYSYEALNTRANWYAQKLIGMGIGRGLRVGICVGRTPEMLAALLGILKTGAAYVPLDPTHPKDRLGFILSDAKVAAIVIESDLQNLIEGQSVRPLALDDDASGQSAHANPGVGIEPADPAYLMFTSGTTGRPKGVPIHHGALVNLLSFCTRELECRPDDVVAAIATISFDISCIELFLPLLVGARIEVVPAAATADGDQLARLISERAITLFQATPATWRMLLAVGWQGEPGMRAISTAEPLPRDIAEYVVPRVAKLWNGYGPTETTVWSTIEEVRNLGEPLTIGRPIANTQIHIIGQDGRELGVGEVGEICIGGDGVASGYIDRPELTAERFVQQGDGRRYRTGDLGRWLPDGRLLHLGRIDHQVKIRGVRIELGEIESVIQDVRDVRQAIVVADKREGTERLVAFCTTVPAAIVTQAKILEHAASKLPAYMLPVSIVILEDMPLSPNGKVDRMRLLEIERAHRSSRDIVEPETAAEKKLLEIVKVTMAIDRVGVTDNLFELGIDSLKIFQIVSRANKENLGVTPRMLMLTRTVRAALAEASKTPQSASVKMMEIKAIPRDRLRRAPV